MRRASAVVVWALLVVGSARADVNLVALFVGPPSTGADCGTLDVAGTVDVMVENAGSDPASSPFQVLAFEDLDLDGVYTPGIDQALGSAPITPPLASGAVLTVPVPISGTLQFRDGLIHAWVDSTGLEAESDESDNVLDTGAACERAPPAPNFDLVIEWQWTEAPVLSAPLVGDVNADGTPDVVFATTLNEIVVLDGRTGVEHWRTNDPNVSPAGASTPALGELDGDPGLEVVSFAGSDNLAMWDDDGSLVWLSEFLGAQHALLTGGVSLADIDCDGEVEALFGPDVIRTSDGTRYWLPAPGGTWGTSLTYAGITSAVDVNDDGILEVLAGPTAYVLDAMSGFGTGLWRQRSVPDGFTAVGQFDADPFPEIVVVPPGRVAVLEGENGDVKWDVPLPWSMNTCLPAWSRGGPPIVADVDGDGLPEIGIADSELYVVFEHDGTLKWQVPVQDCSSAATSSTVFDFDGDGAAEVVYQDEYFLHVLRGTDGFELASHPSSSGTVQEMPTIADVDGDNRAEIIAALHPWEGMIDQGIRVYGDRNDNWVNARRIWNQHAYHVDNVNDDGTIPPVGTGGCEEHGWLTHNTYRLQRPAGATPLGLPDVTLTVIGDRLVDSATCGTELIVDLRIGNGGAIPAGRPIDVWIHEGDPSAGGRPVASMTVPDLAPGEWADVTLTARLRRPETFHLIADDDGTGAGVVTECREDNNECTVVVAMVPPPPRLPDPVGNALRATAHGDPRAATITGTFEWFGDEGLPRPVGEHYHLLRSTRPDLLVPIAGTEPWTQLTWVDATPASSALPTCHYLRVLAADDCEQVQPLP